MIHLSRRRSCKRAARSSALLSLLQSALRELKTMTIQNGKPITPAIMNQRTAQSNAANTGANCATLRQRPNRTDMPHAAHCAA